MSYVLPTSVGVPGEVIDADKLNAPFEDLETAAAALDETNIRYNSITARTISSLSIIPAAGYQASRNTSATPAPYSAPLLTDVPITHGTSAMQVGPFIVPDEGFLRIHWHVHVYDGTFATPGLNNFSVFSLYWDLGAGYVITPSAPHWGLGYYNEDSTGLRDQTYNHNCAGSWVYYNTTGSPVIIQGVRLYISPSSQDPTDIINLGEDTLIGIVIGK